jgi:hypothetical protein
LAFNSKICSADNPVLRIILNKVSPSSILYVLRVLGILIDCPSFKTNLPKIQYRYGLSGPWIDYNLNTTNYTNLELNNVDKKYLQFKNLSSVFSNKDYYLSFEKINKIPSKVFSNSISISIYNLSGDLIEECPSIKYVKDKYKIPAHKLKNIQLGNKYYENYIIKYNSK